MNHCLLQVPPQIQYLSELQGFDSCLSQYGDKLILAKGGCGCGATEYYLSNDIPVLLVSPRAEMLRVKERKPGRTRPLYYFDRSDYKKVPADVSIDSLRRYINNPFSDPGFVPKVLVTYDSLGTVVNSLAEWGCLESFVIIADEFPCMFSDVFLKGTREMNSLYLLDRLPNRVIYISATPLKPEHLDELPEFRNTSMVELEWSPDRFEEVTVVREKMKSPKDKISEIIRSFRATGHFNVIRDGNNVIYSREGVFFVNDVSVICAIIKDFGLTPADTIVVCGNTSKNKERLRKVGFELGHVPGELEPNPTFMFCTKATFEGSDFYSTQSTTFVFGNASRSNLALDLSQDLVQIAGRCRYGTDKNPFRRWLYFFYRLSDDEMIQSAKDEIRNRMAATDDILSAYEGMNNRAALDKLADSQNIWHFAKDYVDVKYLDDGSAMAVRNELARVADIRAIEIQELQYKSPSSIRTFIQGCKGFNVSRPQNQYNSPHMREFIKAYDSTGCFVERMKLYEQTAMLHPELMNDIEMNPNIDDDLKRFHNSLSAEKIRALGYQRDRLEAEVNAIQSIENIQACLADILTPACTYTNAQVKAALAQVYDQLNIVKAAKAKDITMYFPDAQGGVRVKDGNGRIQRGFKF